MAYLPTIWLMLMVNVGKYTMDAMGYRANIQYVQLLCRGPK